MAQADEIITDLKQIAAKITPLTYIVVASHGHYDELALEQALRSKAAYVALVASKNRSAAVLAYLRGQGLTEPELARLKYPAGLDIQARRGDEIALSIMAQIVQQRRNAEPLDVAGLLAPASPTEAIDPVCGMTVQTSDAKHTREYNGQLYYFCCSGCQESFRQNPQKYLEQPAPQGEAIDPVCKMTVDIATAKYMSEYQGELYYFCAPGCKLSFDKAPPKYLGLPNGGVSIELV
jgi:xanthine dehydrogenase accessory factor